MTDDRERAVQLVVVEEAPGGYRVRLSGGTVSPSLAFFLDRDKADVFAGVVREIIAAALRTARAEGRREALREVAEHFQAKVGPEWTCSGPRDHGGHIDGLGPECIAAEVRALAGEAPG